VKQVAVIGATGYVGGRLLPVLAESGKYRVRALARTPQKLARADGDSGEQGFEVVKADVQDPESLDHALEGVDYAYYMVHSMGAGGAGEQFHEADVTGARNFAESCARAGVQRIVYLSGLGSEQQELSEHLKSRHATGDALRSTDVPVTELRAAIIVGSGSASFEIVRDLSRKLPVMITPRWVRSRCEPIAIRDVVGYLVAVLDEPRTVGEKLDIGGGEVLTYADLMRGCAHEQGRHCLIVTVPVLTPRLSSYWLHLVTSVDIKIARPLIEGLRNDVVCEDKRIREWLPRDLIGYRQAVRLALTRDRERTARESRWTDAGRPIAAARAGASRLRISPSKERLSDSREFHTNLAPDEAWRRVSRIGGAYGYGGAIGQLWKLRGAIDRLIGGPGLRRGRPFGDDLHAGDAIDFWRVLESDRPHALVLRAEMKVPGEADLEFTIEPDGAGGSCVTQTASLTNVSVWSGFYWYAVLPFHKVVFNRLGSHLLDA
jgi:uncharacterized protein YbjT (DUF2867 family)